MVVRSLDLTLKSALAAAMVAGLSVPAANFAISPAQATPETFADLAEELIPTVVNISTVSRVEVRRPFGGRSPFEDLIPRFQNPNGPSEDEEEPREREARSLGSGFVIGEDGYIVTNNHVIDDAEEITVRFADEQEFEAELVGTDPDGDLALLKINAGRKLKAAKWGDSDAIRVGDWVVAIGNPFGLGGTVTAGILSARSRNINSGSFDDYLQSDASINRGNSGGPMFNTKGEIIGVNTAILSPTGGNVGIGLAIPSNQAANIIKQLRENGKVQRGYLGIGAQEVTKDIAESLGLEDDKGALVSSVNPDGPAAKAGFEPGDIIIEMNGKPVKSLNRLLLMLGRAEVGATVPVKIIRDGKQKSLKVTLAERPARDALAQATSNAPSSSKSKTETVLDMELKTLTKQELSDLGIEALNSGVLITRVKGNSDGARKGLMAGDVIEQANNKSIASLPDLEGEVKKVREAGREKILLRIYRKASETFLHYALEIPDES